MSYAKKTMRVGSGITTSQLQSQINQINKLGGGKARVEYKGGQRQVVIEGGGVNQAVNSAQKLSGMITKVDPTTKVTMQRTVMESGGMAGPAANAVAKPVQPTPQASVNTGGVIKPAVTSSAVNPSSTVPSSNIKPSLSSAQYMQNQAAPMERAAQREEMINAGAAAEEAAGKQLIREVTSQTGGENFKPINQQNIAQEEQNTGISEIPSSSNSASEDSGADAGTSTSS